MASTGVGGCWSLGTISTRTHRMMAILSGSQLKTTELFDIVTDPKELHNLVKFSDKLDVISKLYEHLFKERGDLLAMRGITSPPIPN